MVDPLWRPRRSNFVAFMSTSHIGQDLLAGNIQNSHHTIAAPSHVQDLPILRILERANRNGICDSRQGQSLKPMAAQDHGGHLGLCGIQRVKSEAVA